MKQYKKYTHVVLFILLIYVVLVRGNESIRTNTIIPIYFHPLAMEVSKQQDERMREITAKATHLYEAPEDAYIDRVWKKTPGRDGRKVDVQKTLENMRAEDRVDDSLFIYEAIKPDIQLANLPPSPIYRGHPKKDMVALLINVSWGTKHIPPMLNILKQHNVKATFFLEGKWAKDNSDYVKMIVDQGHLIGNHAYNHPDMKRLSREEMSEQINQTNEIIEALTSETPTWFAPPSGSYNMAVVEEAAELGMETILWTVDTIDWKKPSVHVMHEQVMSNIHNGATILMHPTEVMENGLDLLIESIVDEGYRIGTVDQLMRSER